MHKFADVTERPLGPQYMVGTIAYVEEPLPHILSVRARWRGRLFWWYVCRETQDSG